MKRYYKRKIVGGSIFGQVFDTAKQAFMAGTKILAEKLPFAKTLAKNTAEAMIKSQATKLGEKAVQKIIDRVRSSTPTNAMSKQPQDESKKSKNTLDEPNVDARLVINRLLSGSGFKKL